MGRWLWDVRNELIKGETGWSSFKERKRGKNNGEIDVES